ncbi:chromate resistance protein ChrB domain-containing protein [Caballeronia humi]|uniref:Chromate resistance exported protein n=1 Tax=Caballeronia humi TaxID=326474 RepID=A0A158HDX7_9BURK|nr:chromate resistance protein ChrB domain-containing protein [Caballeronia humi]SAL42548.1 chromate resistance exported protein [Caballeronia humi]
MKEFADWLLLILTLPTDNATARMRYWRALKAKGCAVLRDGAYLLPLTADDGMAEMCGSIGQAGGTAYLVRFASADETQEEEFRALFDRTDEYTNFRRSVEVVQRTLVGLNPAEITKLMRKTRKEFEALAAVDFFPNEASVRARSAWDELVQAADAVLSPGEPHSGEGDTQLLNRASFQGRLWATRRHMWVDRVASAWLIKRFIDGDARFLWLVSPDACPKDAVGFDFDGATFSHVNERVTFEVLAVSFGIDGEPGMTGLANMVHSLDVGGLVVPEAAGFEAVMTGARERGLSDDELLFEMGRVLDLLLAHFAATERRRAK